MPRGLNRRRSPRPASRRRAYNLPGPRDRCIADEVTKITLAECWIMYISPDALLWGTIRPRRTCGLVTGASKTARFRSFPRRALATRPGKWSAWARRCSRWRMRAASAVSTMRGAYTRSYQKPARLAMHSRSKASSSSRETLLQVNREHAPASAAAERSVFYAVVENHQIARLHFQGHARDVRSENAPILLAVVRARGRDRFMDPVGIGFVDPVTPRHNPEAAAQAPHFIEIECQFDRAVARSPPVAVPNARPVSPAK